MKRIALGAALVAGLMAAPALAQDSKFGASLGVTGVSEYFFRGISQTDDRPALQAGAELTYALSDTYTLYGGVWASTVDFGDDTDAEVDPNFGIRATFGNLGLDLGVIQYLYVDKPSGADLNFTEFKLLASYDLGFVVPSAGIYYSPDYTLESGDAYYVTAGVSIPLPVTALDPQIVANVGKQYVDDNAAFGFDDYVDWNIGLFASYMGFIAGIQYVDTNLSKTECPDACQAAAVFSLGYSYSF